MNDYVILKKKRKEKAGEEIGFESRREGRSNDKKEIRKCNLMSVRYTKGNRRRKEEYKNIRRF